MKKITLLLTTLMFLGCAVNPLTGKKQLVISSEAQLLPMAFQQYSDFISKNQVIKGTSDARRVSNVGQKIKAAAIKWMSAKGFAKQIEPYKWEYSLIQDKAINAWCMPGGKIAIFTGIMPVTKNEDGLATVMGHEVAHALLAHSRSRLDATLLKSVGAQAVGMAISNKSQAIQEAFKVAYGLGANLGSLAYGRNHELEADHLGLILMTMAGYNPDNSIKFWGRMSQAGSSNTPEFLSTHPSHNKRINNIKKLLPSVKKEANKYK